MKKNIVYLIVDSFVYDYYNSAKDKSPTEFIDSLIEDSLYVENIYSEAPYTEAAIIPLLTGTHVLDYGGYLGNLQGRPTNIFKIFKRNGYKTYSTIYDYSNSKSFLKDVDEYYYASFIGGFALKSYRLKYYSDLMKNCGLSNEQLKDIVNLFEDYFDFLYIYFNDLENNPYRCNFIYKYVEFEEFNEYKELYIREKTNFYRDKNKYVIRTLEDLDSSELFKYCNITFKASKEFENFFRKKINKLGIKLGTKQLFKTIFKSRKNKSLKTLLKRKISLKHWIMYTMNYTGLYIYSELSAKAHLDKVLSYIKEDRDENKFILCHLMDVHYPFNFISKEYSDRSLLEKEYGEALDFIKENKESTNIFYDLALRYFDNKLKDFFQQLKEIGEEENTSVIMVSDHGSSYLGKIFRSEKVTTLYNENYKNQLIAFGEDIPSLNIKEERSNVDILPTLIDILNFKPEEFLVGKSIFDKGNEYIIFEYYGAGCPDIHKKNKQLAVKNKRYKVCLEFLRDNNDKKILINSIYDLKLDPLELNNAKEALINNEEVKALLKIAIHRIRNMNR